MDAISRLWNRAKSQAVAYYRALTRSFNYSTDTFFGLDFLLAIAGARLNSQNTKLQHCWTIYRWTLVLLWIVMCWNSVDNVVAREKLEILLSCLQGVIGYLFTISRTLLILWHYETLMEVRRYVNLRCFGKNLQPSLGIRSEAFYRIRKLVVPVVAITFIVVLSFIAVDFSDHHYLKFPVKIKAEFNIFLLIYKVAIFFSGIGFGFMTVLVFLALYMVLAGLLGELKVITLTFAVIFNETNRRVQEKLQMELGNSRQKDLMKKYYFWKFVQEEFGECISLHAEFLTLLNKIRPFLNATFLIVYYSNVLSLSSGAIYVSQMKTVTLFSVESLYYCLWVAIECAILTRTVSLLTEANESIAQAVYNLDWPTMLEYEKQYQDEYRSVRTMMINVMAVAQQPLRLDCFGFFEFTQDRFYELLNMAYSVFTFFRNFV